MKWKLDVPVSSSFDIKYEDNILMLGSCFAENMGQFLTDYKFNSVVNPFGILYNPISISEGLERLIFNQNFEENDLFLHQELYHSWMHHGRFSDVSKENALSKIQTEFQEAQEKIEHLDVLILTLGSAFVYEKNDTKRIVANCHKVPNKQFTKRMLSVEEIKTSLEGILRKLLEKRPDLKIILTVSPVRHIRDGIIKNNRSKASLLLAVQALEEEFRNAVYFPSYEIQMDELRNYRFYASDLVHLSEEAVRYIWEKFSNAFFNEKTQEILAEIKPIILGLQHRPIHGNTIANQKFQANLKRKIQEMEEKYSFLKF
ncbi:MAG: GSCFA domain-containing protein [Saprospiraceae bacterium]